MLWFIAMGFINLDEPIEIAGAKPEKAKAMHIVFATYEGNGEKYELIGEIY